MSQPVLHSPAEIIREIMVAEGWVEDYNGASWPSFVGRLPNGPGVVLTDTTGVNDGRYMAGEEQLHPGLQLRVRNTKYGATRAKIMGLVVNLTTDLAVPYSVASLSTNYNVHNVQLSGDLLSLGTNADTGLVDFTANFITSISVA